MAVTENNKNYFVENFKDEYPEYAIICMAVVNNAIVHVVSTEADKTPDQAADNNIVSIPYSSVLETNVYDLHVGIMRSLISKSAKPITSLSIYKWY
ncbi:Hypothetical predicted protein [Mytilus galloprovincialis]|uniref:Uncharacterized protein n=1 Tax=Mytilus galloprovincialis TaxID=29158 RepID=A0A8B6GM48_MYTGA|nr:Hypothetical predicted protein [Mytilus galloprovincialis]